MSDTPAPRITHPLPPILSHTTLNLLAGASGVGKTALIAYFARCLLRGETLLGYKPDAVPAVGYLGADRPWTDDSCRWFEKAGVAEIPHYSLIEDTKFDINRFTHAKPGVHATLFEEILEQKFHPRLPPGSVLFVDPIALFLGADMNRYTSMAVGCMHLYRVILRHRLCVIGVDHSSKQKGDNDTRYTRLQDRISGSMAKLGYTATQMYLAGPQEMDADHHTFLWNPHHAKSQTFPLYQDPETGLFRPYPSHDRAASPRESLDDTLRALHEGLPLYPETTAVASLITLYADTHRATLFRWLKHLEAVGLVVSPQKGQWAKLVPGAESTPDAPPPDKK